MSIKTIAIKEEVYSKLARFKRGSESFTKTIDRLLKQQVSSNTCGDALASASVIFSDGLSDTEADSMEQIIQEGRDQENWTLETPE